MRSCTQERRYLLTRILSGVFQNVMSQFGINQRLSLREYFPEAFIEVPIETKILRPPHQLHRLIGEQGQPSFDLRERLVRPVPLVQGDVFDKIPNRNAIRPRSVGPEQTTLNRTLERYFDGHRGSGTSETIKPANDRLADERHLDRGNTQRDMLRMEGTRVEQDALFHLGVGRTLHSQ